MLCYNHLQILRIQKTDSKQANVGKLINLLSSDVSRLDQVYSKLHCFIVAPFQLAIFSYLLWNELGIASLGWVACIIFILPLQGKPKNYWKKIIIWRKIIIKSERINIMQYLVFLGRFSMYFRTHIANSTDERGRFLNEIIKGIRLIKMHAWETPFASVVGKLRRYQMHYTSFKIWFWTNNTCSTKLACDF